MDQLDRMSAVLEAIDTRPGRFPGPYTICVPKSWEVFLDEDYGYRGMTLRQRLMDIGFTNTAKSHRVAEVKTIDGDIVRVEKAK